MDDMPDKLWVRRMNEAPDDYFEVYETPDDAADIDEVVRVCVYALVDVIELKTQITATSVKQES